MDTEKADHETEFKPTDAPPVDIKTRQKPILPFSQLDKRKVITTIGIIALLIIYSFLNSCGGKDVDRKSQEADERGVNSTSEVLAKFPSTYPEWKDRASNSYKQEEPKPMVHGQNQKDTWSLEQERIRLKRALEARGSDVSFKVQIEKASNNLHNIGNETAFETERASFGNIPEIQISQQNTRDEANRQDDKRSFLESTSDPQGELQSRLRSPASPYQLKAGTVIPGVMIQGINSDLPGFIQGQVSEQVFDSASGRYLLIPQGTRAIGRYDSRITFGQKRLLIVWNRLIFPDGSTINLEVMPGTDVSGIAGVSGTVDRHFGEIIFATIIGSGFGAGAQIAEGSRSVTEPTFEQLALQGSARTINQVGQRFTEKTLELQPTITIEPGARFNILVTRDVTLKPYKR